MDLCDSLIKEPCFGSGVIDVGWHRVGHGLQFKSRLQSIFTIQYKFSLCKVCFFPKIIDKMYSFHRNLPMQFEINEFERDLTSLKTKLSQTPEEHKQRKIDLSGKISELEEKLSRYTHCSDDEKSTWDDSVQKSSNGPLPDSLDNIITDYLSEWSETDVFENKDLIDLVKNGDVFTNETESALRFVTPHNEFHIPANYALDDCKICMKHPHLILSHKMKGEMLRERKHSNARSKKKFLHRPLNDYSCNRKAWRATFDLPRPRCGRSNWKAIGEQRYICLNCNPNEKPPVSSLGMANQSSPDMRPWLDEPRVFRRSSEGNKKHWKDL